MHIPESNVRHRAYWVRRYDADSLTYFLAPVDGKPGEPLLKVKVDPAGDKSRVTEALSAALDHTDRGAEPVRLVMRRSQKLDKDGMPVGPKENLIHQVRPSELSRDKDSRKIVDPATGEVISTWTGDLDRAVFQHSEMVVFHAAMEQQRKMVEDPAFFASVRERALAAMVEMQASSEARSGPLSGITREMMESHLASSGLIALKGNEAFGEDGAIRQRRYDTTAQFMEQVREVDFSEKGRGLSQLANFSMQRAIVDSLAEACVQATEKDGVIISACEAAQDDLLKSKSLVAGHPKKESRDFAAESAETARIIGARSLAGVLDMTGAEPANVYFDPLTLHDSMGAPISKFQMHEQIKKEVHTRFPELQLPADKMQAYLGVGSHRAQLYKEAFAKKVFRVQMGVVPKDRKPKPPKDLPEVKKDDPMADVAEAAARGMAAAATGVENAIKDSGQIPFPGL